MYKKIAFLALLVLSLVLSACGPTATTLPFPTPSVAPATQPPASPTSAPATQPPATTIPQPSATATTAAQQPTVAPTVNIPPTGSNPGATNYIDDRSTASQVIVSYYNAVNRREYSRAYGYYTDPLATLGNFNSFSNGYANTTSVDLVFGQITSDVGAGQTYFTVPVILKATTSNSGNTNYAACYIVHQANPSNFGGPNFQPMSIDKGQAKTMQAGAADAAALATACSGLPVGPNPGTVGAESMDISKNNFIDNRSGPIETVSSLLNAINLKQYSRAYSYFDSPQSFPGAYNSYSAGYANTDTITAGFGPFTTEGAAGTLYYKVPMWMKVTTTSNTNQTFVGCYTLKLPQPANQTVPPFRPLSIVSGHFTQQNNSADVTSMLATACNP